VFLEERGDGFEIVGLVDAVAAAGNENERAFDARFFQRGSAYDGRREKKKSFFGRRI
jgi:hypothetical protein